MIFIYIHKSSSQVVATGAHSTAYIFATELNALISFARIMFPASQLSGLSAAGSCKSDIIALHADCKLHAGDHSLFKISKQISPV